MDKEIINRESIQAWVKKYLVDDIEVEESLVLLSASFDAMGLDSVKQVELIGAMEDWLGTKIEPTLAYDYPTIAALSREISLQINKSKE